MNTQELIDEINGLPVEQRAEIAHGILQGLNPPDPEIEIAWLEEIRKREKSYQEGKTTLISGDQVIQSIRKRLAR